MELATTILGITVSSAAMIALLKIIAIDIVLSGDNAIVIAMATRNLPKEQQNKAILWGTAGAVTLRILFAVIIVWLLQIPYVNIIGGALLLWIAYKVLLGGEEDTNISAHNGLMKAIGTIIMADVVMSLDNVVAVAGAADGHIVMIAIGVAISIPIMIFGSKFIVKAMEKYSWIGYVGSGILAWTAGEMIMRDKHIIEFIGISHGLITYMIIIILTTLVLTAGYTSNKKAASKRRVKQYG
ncbi:TerC family protein [Lederbergia citrea]|uniref:TerC family protein n=2 Tax=Lederbergia citrea TaxID=2833581 RepID=A0A942URV0_9BACI|nr:TerC family protein [Lederbergia citrea]MBS4178592.1 TerC family protein [Lederbergia citrea]MBS4205280.1 TerC family protein [Lederbergia citrea]MBS4222859.1 TerC family protein [Lederbergia citrea]